MPMYYFHIRKAQELTRDEKGQLLDNAKAAMSEATRLARELIERSPIDGDSLEDQSIEVFDNADTFQFRLPLKFDFI